ncbi:MAG TPA: glycosyl hydrolase, partial [Pyrinomonadaceae bacterium]|nr:glycosyl hydrolase [Pyrinomonadaceae bacterium]
ATRWASSANHIYGHQVTSSETWTWLHSPVFRATPLDMKAEADLHFLVGVNQLIAHGWPYTPPQVDYPGWRFYASAVFDEKNPWWIVMPDITRYLQRMSYLLRQGQPSNDVALYLPNSDAWAHFTAGNVHMIEALRDRVGVDVMPQILESGYDLDFFDDDALLKLGRVENGALVLGQSRYRVVVLPGVERIPVETLRKLEEFVRRGGVLVATRRVPQIAPGFRATEADEREVQEISRRLFEGKSAPAHFVKDESQLGTTLNALVRPDVALTPSVPEIGFVHRKTADAEIYFVANTSNERKSVKARFRVQGLQPEWWDPMTGRVSAAEVQSEAEGSTTVALDLEPYGSRVIAFTKRTLQKPTVQNTGTLPSPIDLSNNWQVTFGQNGNSVLMDRLRSWTEAEETRYFSGTATYEKEVTVPESMLRTGLTVKLDFGEGKPIPVQQLKAGMQAWLDAPVREAAVVYINNARAGSIWCPPYSLDVTKFLRVGTNKIRIVVANLALNYMAGRRLPDYKLLNLRYGERFQAQDMDKVQPVPAGLLGPIHLIATVDSNSHQ